MTDAERIEKLEADVAALRRDAAGRADDLLYLVRGLRTVVKSIDGLYDSFFVTSGNVERLADLILFRRRRRHSNN